MSKQTNNVIRELKGFHNWWHNRIKGPFITNDEFDRIVIKFNELNHY